MNYDACNVIKLAREHSRAFSFEKRKLASRLARISDERRYGEAYIMGSGVERDDAVSALVGFGSGSFTDYMYGGSILGASIPLSKDYTDGLLTIGIPNEETSRIARCLEQGMVHLNVLEFIAENGATTESLHPDKYPWDTKTFDIIARGFENKDIDCNNIWKNATAYLNKHGKNMPVTCDITLGASLALTHLFELYALAKYHDIGKLNRERMKVHF